MSDTGEENPALGGQENPIDNAGAEVWEAGAEDAGIRDSGPHGNEEAEADIEVLDEAEGGAQGEAEAGTETGPGEAGVIGAVGGRDEGAMAVGVSEGGVSGENYNMAPADDEELPLERRAPRLVFLDLVRTMLHRLYYNDHIIVPPRRRLRVQPRSQVPSHVSGIGMLPVPGGSGEGAAAMMPEGSGEGATALVPQGSEEGAGEGATAMVSRGSGEGAAAMMPEGSGEGATALVPRGSEEGAGEVATALVPRGSEEEPGEGAAAMVPQGSGEGATALVPRGSEEEPGEGAAAMVPQGSGEGATALVPRGSGEGAATSAPEDQPEADVEEPTQKAEGPEETTKYQYENTEEEAQDAKTKEEKEEFNKNKKDLKRM